MILMIALSTCVAMPLLLEVMLAVSVVASIATQLLAVEPILCLLSSVAIVAGAPLKQGQCCRYRKQADVVVLVLV